MSRSILLFLILFQTFSPNAISQKLRKADKEIVEELQSDIDYLSNDKLEGRRSGTSGETLASDYIISSFIKAGLKPLETAEHIFSDLKYMMAEISAIHGLQ